IPYDKGWHATLDGNEVPVLDVLDGYLFIQTGAGHHTVELTYHPPYLNLGIVVSTATLVVALVWTLAEWLDKKKGSVDSL
ncbi:MAG: YfhO family protein, partial [Peptoniphilaceae bacterium]|nr:YfhO family protein [Peptoniphilaceae bacterium]